MYPPYASVLALNPYPTLIHGELREQSYAFRADDDLLAFPGFHGMSGLIFNVSNYWKRDPGFSKTFLNCIKVPKLHNKMSQYSP